MMMIFKLIIFEHYNNKYWKIEGHGVQATADKR